MRTLNQDISHLKSMAINILYAANSETKDRHSCTRLERSDTVEFKERCFSYDNREDSWNAQGVTLTGHRVVIESKNTYCSCPDSKPSYQNPPCKHKCALAILVLNYKQGK